MSFYVFLSSKDSIDRFPNNTFDDFIVDLDTSINLEEPGGLGFNLTWTVALTELSLDTLTATEQILPQSVSVVCDLAVPSYINSTQRSVLRVLPATGEFSSSLHLPYYIAVSKLRFSRVRIQLQDSKFDKLQLSSGWKAKSVLKCTLHFLRS